MIKQASSYFDPIYLSQINDVRFKCVTTQTSHVDRTDFHALGDDSVLLATESNGNYDITT